MTAVQDQVLEYLVVFSEWLEKAEKNLAKVEKKYKLEKASGGKVPSKDLVKLMNSLRNRIEKVTNFLKENKDLADSFCHHAEKLADNLSKTLQKPRSLSPEIISGLQSLQKTVLGAILSLTKSFKSALSSHHTEHEETPVTLVHQDKRPKTQSSAVKKPHTSPHQQEQARHRHSFTRTGKE